MAELLNWERYQRLRRSGWSEEDARAEASEITIGEVNGRVEGLAESNRATRWFVTAAFSLMTLLTAATLGLTIDMHAKMARVEAALAAQQITIP